MLTFSIFFTIRNNKQIKALEIHENSNMVLYLESNYSEENKWVIGSFNSCPCSYWSSEFRVQSSVFFQQRSKERKKGGREFVVCSGETLSML